MVGDDDGTRRIDLELYTVVLVVLACNARFNAYCGGQIWMCLCIGGDGMNICVFRCVRSMMDVDVYFYLN